MQVVKADATLAKAHEDAIPGLVHSTGPSSYDYQFGTGSLLDTVVRKSWYMPDTLFSHDACHLALDGDTVAGFLISFHAPEFRPRGENLAPLWKELLASGELNPEDVSKRLECFEAARWLNPETRPGIYYIHAVATKPDCRGQRIGLRLVQTAIDTAKSLGHRSVELDVLSDNPAVGFYRSLGFELLAETKAPKPFAGGVPVEYRMGLPL
ncbi:MAG: GNAT family N-acetyltransferase [Pseudomonadota bacterium]